MYESLRSGDRTCARFATHQTTRIASRFTELEKDAPIAIYCAGGYRSMIASFLQKQVFNTNIQGGFGKLKQFDIQIVEGQSCSNHEYKRNFRNQRSGFGRCANTIEFQAGSVVGAINIPMNEVVAKIDDLKKWSL